MKNLTTIFASAFLAAAVSFSASAQGTVPGCATIVRVHGIATYTLDNNTWYPLLPGKILSAGATIRTGEDGVVDIVLGKSIQFPQSHKAPDRISPASDAAVRGLVAPIPAAEQNVIRLTSGTVLAIDKLNTTDTGADTIGDTELNLKSGRIYASVKKLNATSQYLVKIPTGIAGVRGTKFSIGADGGVAVFESSSSGLVLSVTIDSVTKTFLIPPGQMILNQNGEPTTIPPGLQQTLNDGFVALQTVYTEIINYDKNNANNQQYISPTNGGGSGSGSGSGGGPPPSP